MAKKSKLKIERVPLDQLHEAARNARTHPARNQEAIRRSLEKFGQVEPLVVRRENNEIIGGNGRIVEMRALGWTEADVVFVDVSEDTAAALGVALNRTAELAGWDESILVDTLQGLDDEEFDLGDMGFNPDELGKLPGWPDEPEDELPEAQIDKADELQKKWGTKSGQLWVIPGKAGEHRLLCGDATSEDDLSLATNGNIIKAVLTDPPYGIGFEYASHDDSRDRWFALMNAVIPIIRSLAPFVIMPCGGLDRMGWWYRNHAPDWLIAWYKGSPGHCSHIGFNDWEALLVWGKPTKQMHDYFQTECGFRDGDGHPCPKPIDWAEWLCERAAESGTAILDPFLGSGTTMVAAEQLGRVCYGIEIEPKYVAVALERMKDMGLEPRLV